jgi:sulfite exporter TauE/SafE
LQKLSVVESKKGIGLPTSIFGIVMLIILGMALTGRLPMPNLPQINENTGLWLIFLSGLSVGGLSCLAVQGGLLATTIASSATSADESHSIAARAAPVAQFLLAKLVAYTAVGALLGYFGSKIPVGAQGWLMITIGVFMLIVAMQMYNTHPLLRYFAFQPPKAVQRLLRKQSKQGGPAGPLILGALTVTIPCGVTLAMEGLAIASESPMRGAMIMAAFTLGTVPLFAGLGVAATQLGARAFPIFKPIAALTLVVIAFLSIRSGARIVDLAGIVTGSGPQIVSSADGNQWQERSLQVEFDAYVPEQIQIDAGVPTKLNLVSDELTGCMRSFLIPSLNIEQSVLETGTVVVDLPAFPSGSSIDFICGMGMFKGQILVQ